MGFNSDVNLGEWEHRYLDQQNEEVMTWFWDSCVSSSNLRKQQLVLTIENKAGSTIPTPYHMTYIIGFIQ